MKRALSALLLLVAMPVLASEAPAKPRKERLICTSEASTGSHLKKRTCVTESERKARQLADQERARQLQRSFKKNVETP